MVAPSSDVLVLPVSGVINDSLALNMGVEAIVGWHARVSQVGRELSVESMESGPLWGHL